MLSLCYSELTALRFMAVSSGACAMFHYSVEYDNAFRYLLSATRWCSCFALFVSYYVSTLMFIRKLIFSFWSSLSKRDSYYLQFYEVPIYVYVHNFNEVAQSHCFSFLVFSCLCICHGLCLLLNKNYCY